MRGMVLLVVVLVAALFAGCAAPPGPDVPQSAEERTSVAAQPDGYGRDGSGEVEVYSEAAVTNCSNGDEVAYHLNWEHVPLRQQANDTSVSVSFDWAATNPTTEWLRFRLVTDSQMGGPGRLEWDGASPQVLVLVGADLEELPETFYVQVSATGCQAERPVGAHVAPADSAQAVAWSVAWNRQVQG